MADGKNILIWDAVTGRQVAVLRGHERDVRSVVFGADGSRILSGSQDQTARLWDAATAKQIAVFRDPDEAVVAAIFSPDARRIVIASGATTRIWDVATKKQIATLDEHGVNSASLSPDGTKLVTTSSGVAHIWTVDWVPMSTDDLVRETCTLAGYPDGSPPIDACAGYDQQ